MSLLGQVSFIQATPKRSPVLPPAAEHQISQPPANRRFGLYFPTCLLNIAEMQIETNMIENKNSFPWKQLKDPTKTFPRCYGNNSLSFGQSCRPAGGGAYHAGMQGCCTEHLFPQDSSFQKVEEKHAGGPDMQSCCSVFHKWSNFPPIPVQCQKEITTSGSLSHSRRESEAAIAALTLWHPDCWSLTEWVGSSNAQLVWRKEMHLKSKAEMCTLFLFYFFNTMHEQLWVNINGEFRLALKAVMLGAAWYQ